MTDLVFGALNGMGGLGGGVRSDPPATSLVGVGLASLCRSPAQPSARAATRFHYTKAPGALSGVPS